MNAKLQKLISTAALGLALYSYSIPAWAGKVNLPQVSIVFGYVTGSMAGARYSADNQQYIGCSFSNAAGPYVVCSAMDQTGKSFFCTSREAGHAKVVKSITDTSYIMFSTSSPNSYTCSGLRVYNDSSSLR